MKKAVWPGDHPSYNHPLRPLTPIPPLPFTDAVPNPDTLPWPGRMMADKTGLRRAFLDLPNPDSAVDALPLSKGRILLAFNDSRNNRETLKLAVSDDRGLNWIRIYTLENLPGQEFSYPYMIRGKNGIIHLVYTWKRKRIKHVVFNEAWVDQKLERATQK